MIGPVWLLRMAQWARNPPSWGRVKLVVFVVLICFAIYGIELLWGWPDWLSVNGKARLPKP